jgi:DNA-directed RNA polymerase I subunit RPA1
LFVEGISFEAFERYPEKFDLKRIATNHSYALI